MPDSKHISKTKFAHQDITIFCMQLSWPRFLQQQNNSLQPLLYLWLFLFSAANCSNR